MKSKSDAQKLFEMMDEIPDRQENYTFNFKGIRSDVTLPGLDTYSVYRTDDVFSIAKGLESIFDEEYYSNPYSNIPSDIAKKIESKEAFFSGAFLLRIPVLWINDDTGGERGQGITYVVIYQKDDPILESFYLGHEEGHLLENIDNTNKIVELWNNYSPANFTSKRKNVITLDELRTAKSGLAIGERNAHLAGLYSTFLRFDPQEAVRTISSGNDTPEFVDALEIIGYEGDYTFRNDSTAERIRAAVYGKDK